ncbi:MAG: hypothetical protein AB8G23_22345 [Myxococcota bacterium]
MRELEANTDYSRYSDYAAEAAAGYTDETHYADPAGLIDLTEYAVAVPPKTLSLTNSPGCVPCSPAQENSNDSDSGKTIASAPERTSRQQARPRSMRTVRVDAWAAPASASWGRKRTTLRKVNSQRLRGTSRASASRSTDWALPF